MGSHNALPKVTMSCQFCGSEFTVPGSHAKRYASRSDYIRRYCSATCYNQGRKIPHPTFNCETCGTEVLRRKRGSSYDRRQRFCTIKCAVAKQVRPTGRGKGWIDKNGYLVLRKENGRDIYAHREAMEKLLGRPLRADETVHHKFGNRADASPGSLELWSSRHGRGQRVIDKIDFAITFLRDYGIPVVGVPLSDAISGIAGLV